jgi:DNA-binding CsgD family transcriptional regulator
MAKLSARDLNAALAFVDEAHSFDDLESFRTGILPGLERLVPCDLVGYNEVDPGAGDALVLTYPEPMLPFAGEALSRLAHQHPLISVQANGDGRAYKISDFLTRRQFHALDLYADLYRRIGAEDQIAFGLPGPMVIGIAMNRDRRSFGERDRAMLDLLRPHLTRAHARLRERARLGELMEALERGLADGDRAVLALGPAGDVAVASGGAIGLLDAYLPGRRGGSLPPELSAWLARTAPPGEGEMALEGDRGRLTIRRVDAGADGVLLVLAEERRLRAEALRSLGLTRRQAEVLRLLAVGRGTDGIAADLFISPQTVRKHLEHVYARLGVHSRAEAIALARKAGSRG